MGEAFVSSKSQTFQKYWPMNLTQGCEQLVVVGLSCAEPPFLRPIITLVVYNIEREDKFDDCQMTKSMNSKLKTFKNFNSNGFSPIEALMVSIDDTIAYSQNELSLM